MQAKVDANAKVNASLLSRIPHVQEEIDRTENQIEEILNDEDLLLCKKQPS